MTHNSFMEGCGGMEKNAGPGVQQTWVLVCNLVLTGCKTLVKSHELLPYSKMEMKTATTFSTSKDYCENPMRLCMGQCFVNLT